MEGILIAGLIAAVNMLMLWVLSGLRDDVRSIHKTVSDIITTINCVHTKVETHAVEIDNIKKLKRVG